MEQYLEAHYGKNWQKVRIPEDEFVEEGYIKNRLYSRKWVPFMVQELEGEDAPSYLCFDFDPDEQEGIFGQLIGVSPAEKIEDCELDFIYPNIFQWANVMIEGMKKGQLAYSEEKDALEFLSRGNFEPSYYSEEERESLEEYIQENIGEFDEVLHELVSPDIHCDIYIVKPTPERNYYTLVTGGMGAYAMNVPDGFNGSPYAEMCINLPPTWNLKRESLANG